MVRKNISRNVFTCFETVSELNRSLPRWNLRKMFLFFAMWWFVLDLRFTRLVFKIIHCLLFILFSFLLCIVELMWYKLSHEHPLILVVCDLKYLRVILVTAAFNIQFGLYLMFGKWGKCVWRIAYHLLNLTPFNFTVTLLCLSFH